MQLLPNLRHKMMQKVRPGNEKRKYLLITGKERTKLQDFFVLLHDIIYITIMYLPKTNPLVLQTDYGNEQYNTLNVNGLVWGIARYIIHPKYSYTTVSDASRGHLPDLSCPCRTRPSDMLSE